MSAVYPCSGIIPRTKTIRCLTFARLQQPVAPSPDSCESRPPHPLLPARGVPDRAKLSQVQPGTAARLCSETNSPSSRLRQMCPLVFPMPPAISMLNSSKSCCRTFPSSSPLGIFHRRHRNQPVGGIRNKQIKFHRFDPRNQGLLIAQDGAPTASPAPLPTRCAALPAGHRSATPEACDGKCAPNPTWS